MTNSTHQPLPDYHTHHELCRHATGKTVDYARAARAAGLTEIAATDHCPTDIGFGKEHRMTLDEFPQYRRDVEFARRDVPEITLLFGVEADYYPECETFLAPFLDHEEFDVVLGSIHFRDYFHADPRRRGVSDATDPEGAWRDYFYLTGKLADTRLYDIVTHIDLPKRFGSPHHPEAIRDFALPALDRIAEAGMAIEINTSGLTHDVAEMYPALHVLSWAAERGIGLTFGSDAHQPERVGHGFGEALALARLAGFTRARRYRKRTWTEYPLP
ncbi:MAG TPA: histidinol-phosphatase HisJ family protein [Kiritimatiellia bacterium]|nr:histidinol-phosphatase HisJ family protein [Kiritimatiellia bacterium]HMO98242.1 histidinol-phosphatase HisJ family protein [Kiritimatiellia bacterium]HMP96587.1 histidinol-phosphatase HisJ family protein [Kiritimatiellia bacterium]